MNKRQEKKYFKRRLSHLYRVRRLDRYDAKIFTMLNHRARRAARKERREGLKPSERRYSDRPCWQTKSFVDDQICLKLVEETSFVDDHLSFREEDQDSRPGRFFTEDFE